MFALRYIHSCLALLETQREMVNAHSCSFFIASLVYIYIYIYECGLLAKRLLAVKGAISKSFKMMNKMR